MQAYLVIAQRVKDRGITKSELARRVDLSDELLRRSLLGMRKINADEFVRLCRELDLEVADFDDNPAPKKEQPKREK